MILSLLLVCLATLDQCASEEVAIGLISVGDITTASTARSEDVFSRLMYHAAQLAIARLDNATIGVAVNNETTFRLAVIPHCPTCLPEPDVIMTQSEKLVIRESVSVILGPFVAGAHDGVGMMGRSMGVAIYSTAILSNTFPFQYSRSSHLTTSVAARGHIDQVAMVTASVLVYYNWTHVGVLYDVAVRPWSTLRTSLSVAATDMVNFTDLVFGSNGVSLLSQLEQLQTCCRSELCLHIYMLQLYVPYLQLWLYVPYLQL